MISARRSPSHRKAITVIGLSQLTSSQICSQKTQIWVLTWAMNIFSKSKHVFTDSLAMMNMDISKAKIYKWTCFLFSKQKPWCHAAHCTVGLICLKYYQRWIFQTWKLFQAYGSSAGSLCRSWSSSEKYKRKSQDKNQEKSETSTFQKMETSSMKEWLAEAYKGIMLRDIREF